MPGGWSSVLLYQQIQSRVDAWRRAGYPATNYPAVADLLRFARTENGALRFLRAAQLRSLETYWHLRLVEGTPRLWELNQRYNPTDADQLVALGVHNTDVHAYAQAQGMDALWARVQDDEAFVRQHKLQAVREMMLLDYPSYILALAMGAGKTVLIGAIIASEFALALEYHPDEGGAFMQNALVFAPGLTIAESLRELADIDYARILPPHLHRPFAATHRLIFTQDGQRDILAVPGSRYNLIVTNTEKIRIQRRVRRHHAWTQLQFAQKVAEAREEANLRLQTLAALPNLGIFSDEAHHAYGREMDKHLKRTRQTVDYLHANTNVIAVVNTTGTPYYKRQPLPDVVIWYGLADGIRDNILKSLAGGIYDYDLADSEQFVAAVVRDFFRDYGAVRLPNGAPARLAIYFPHNDELNALRPVVERTLWQLGYDADIVLRNTNQSTPAEIEAFNWLNEPTAPHRVILLVNKGAEGWNCPSLFACALVRKLTNSRTFVLQASTRCLRQVPGNSVPARLYVTPENRRILERQLRETYGERVDRLRRTHAKPAARPACASPRVVESATVPLPRPQPMRTRVHPAPIALHLRMPDTPDEAGGLRRVTVAVGDGENGLTLQAADRQEVDQRSALRDLYMAAAELAATYRLDAGVVHAELTRLYANERAAPCGVPAHHLPALAAQIEAQLAAHRTEHGEVHDA